MIITTPPPAAPPKTEEKPAAKQEPIIPPAPAKEEVKKEEKPVQEPAAKVETPPAKPQEKELEVIKAPQPIPEPEPKPAPVVEQPAAEAWDEDEAVIEGALVVKKEEIFPLVRTTAFIEDLKKDIPDLIYENINSELGVIYLVRNEKVSLTQGDLKSLRLDMLALKSLAVGNLINQIEVGVEEEGNRYTIVADGKFEASFLVVSELWSKDNIPVEGTITVGVPANNVLLITGSAHPADMNWIRHRVAQAYVESNIPISDKLFEVKGNSLIPLDI